MNYRLKLGSGLFAIAALMGGVAQAQEAAPQGAAAQESDGGLGDIVVTARKRDERLQDVPISAAIISSENLVQSGKKDLVDLSTSVPNLSYQQSAEGSSFVVRGITTRAVSPGVEDSLGVYVDGVLAGRPAAYNQDLTRAERVEVLRGPQGTLFGKNTMSGAISIVTKKPSDSFEASGMASYGNLDAVKLSGSVEGPIADGLSVALSGSYFRRDGYLKNAFDDRTFQNENRAMTFSGTSETSAEARALMRLKLPTVTLTEPVPSPCGFFEMRRTVPPTAFLPNSVPCGPRSTSTRSRSSRSKMAPCGRPMYTSST